MTGSSILRVTPGLQQSRMFRVKGQRSRWRYPHERLTPEHCTVLEDVNLSERGTAESRNGYTLYNATQLTGGEPVVGMWQGEFSTLGIKQVIVTPTKIWSVTGSAAVDITGNALTGAADARCQFAFLKDKLIINNGYDEPQVWAGNDTTPTAAADLAGIMFTKAASMMVHKNLLMFVGTTESSTFYPTRIRWCDINRSTYVVDITNWPVANRYEIYDGGPKIIGCVDNWGTAFIFKADGLYPGQITYDALGLYDFQLGEPRRGFRPISVASLVARPEFIFGAAREGLFVIREDMSVEIINSDDVNTWLAMNQARWQYCQAFVRERDHQVRLLCSGTTNTTGHDQVLVWDWETGDVWLDHPTAVMNFGQGIVISDQEFDWLGSYNGYLYKGNSSSWATDSGTNVAWHIKMAPNDLGMPGVAKKVMNIKTVYRKRIGSQTVNFTVNIDEGEQTAVSDVLTLRPSGYKWNSGVRWNSGLRWPGAGVRPVDTFVNRVCTTIEPEWFSNSPANIEGYMVEFVPLEGMGE